MIKNILKYLKELIVSESPDFTNFQILKNFFLNRKIAKLRSSRKAVKFNIINFKKFKNFLEKENLVEKCQIDKKSFKSEEILINESSELLRKFGFVIIKNAFDKEKIQKFKDNVKNISPKNYFYNNSKNKFEYEMSNELIPLHFNEFLFDDKIINTIEKSCNYSTEKKNLLEKIYVRQATKIIFFNTKKDNINDNWTAGWHVDFPTQFTVHIILDDLRLDQTRMQAIPGTNNLPLIPGKHYNLQNSLIDFKKYFVDCYGPQGTMYIHSGNTLHRNYPVLNTYRYVWSQVYTLDDIFLSMNNEQKKNIFSSSKDYIDKLSKKNKERITPLILFPNKDNKILYFQYNGKTFKETTKSKLSYL